MAFEKRRVIKCEGLEEFPPGQVAQLVERSPEKAGVGGSIPSLATIFNNLQTTFLLAGCNWLHFEFNCNQVTAPSGKLRRTP